MFDLFTLGGSTRGRWRIGLKGSGTHVNVVIEALDRYRVDVDVKASNPAITESKEISSRLVGLKVNCRPLTVQMKIRSPESCRVGQEIDRFKAELRFLQDAEIL
jgi:hypothetical protein